MSKNNRKETETFILNVLGKTTKGGGNKVIYSRLFERLDDKQFEAFIKSLEDGGTLSIWTQSFSDEELDVNALKKIAAEYNIELEEQLVIYDEDTGIKSLTPQKFFVGPTTVRKQRQMWVKKYSAAKDDHSIDDLTGQVMGDSRATGLSQAEVTVLRNLGLSTVANELYNVRGGDVDALRSYRNDLIVGGRTNTNASLAKGRIPKVLDSVHHYFRARMIDNNINKR